jgi:hypothetical protein
LLVLKRSVPTAKQQLKTTIQSKMGLYAKRDVIRSLDFLLYCQFAYMYLLDASLLVLLFRILMQLVGHFDSCIKLTQPAIHA